MLNRTIPISELALRGYAYIASPYSAPTPELSQRRFELTEAFLAWAVAHRVWCFSPIVHNHAMAVRRELPKDAGFWWDFNRTMLRASRAFFRLELDGHLESKGMKQEEDWARTQGLMPIYRVVPVDSSHYQLIQVF